MLSTALRVMVSLPIPSRLVCFRWSDVGFFVCVRVQGREPFMQWYVVDAGGNSRNQEVCSKECVAVQHTHRHKPDITYKRVAQSGNRKLNWMSYE